MDHLLKKFGFLEFSASNVVFGPMQWGPVRKFARKAYDRLGLHGKVSLPQSVNWSKTKAFTTIRSTGEGVSINLAGREPDGIVDPADFEKVRDQVMDALSSFVDPKTGRKPVKAIYRREEIFKGKHADTAPDILMEPAEQYSLTHAKSALEDADWISGDHRLEGVIVAAGPNVKAFEQPPLLVDMAPTILAALGAPASIEHTGRVLHEVVGSDAKVSQAEPRSPPCRSPACRAATSPPRSATPRPTRWRSTSAVSATSSSGSLVEPADHPPELDRFVHLEDGSTGNTKRCLHDSRSTISISVSRVSEREHRGTHRRCARERDGRRLRSRRDLTPTSICPT